MHLKGMEEREWSMPSEAIVVICDESKDLVEWFEVLEYSILENSVEFVLNTSQNSVLFVDVKA